MDLVVVLPATIVTNISLLAMMPKVTLSLATTVEDRLCSVVQAVRCLSVRMALLANMNTKVLPLDVV
jgi:hypothetical protein